MDKLKQVISSLQLEDRRLEVELKRVRQALAVLRGLNGNNGRGLGHVVKRRLSAAARKRIADAQRARWAKVRAAKKAA